MSSQGNGKRTPRAGNRVFGGTYTAKAARGGEVNWDTLRALPKHTRFDAGPLVQADGNWVSEVTTRVASGPLEEPFATRLKHFVHLSAVHSHLCPENTAYAQTCRVVRSLFAYSETPIPSQPELLNMLMAGCVAITETVKVTCTPLETLFPEACDENPAYEWSTALLATARVHCDKQSFGLPYALAVVGPDLKLTEMALKTLEPDNHSALLQSLIQLDSYGIKVTLPDHPMHTYMADAWKLVKNYPGSPVATCAAAMSPEGIADMQYFKCLPEKLLLAHGAPEGTATRPLFNGTAAEALRITKGAFAFMNIPPETHTELIRTIVNGLRPSISKLPSFVIDHINDECFMETAKRARTATVAEFFESEPQYCSDNIPQLSKVCAIGCIVVAVGNYRCRHMAWEYLRAAVNSASTSATGPLYIMYDEGKCLIHANGSPDVSVTDPVAWTFTQPPVVSMHVP